MQNEQRSRLQLLASRQFANYDDMYKVVDFLNKSLKKRDLVFGLTKDQDGTMKISIYEA